MKFLGREAVQLENETLRVTVLVKGGSIAEIFHKQADVSPLWIPPWCRDRQIRGSSPATLAVPDMNFFSHVMGHHVCLDIFGEPSEEERLAGLELHGEASIVEYDCGDGGGRIYATALLGKSHLRLSRTIQLGTDGSSVDFTETVENLLSIDRPIAWTQHVTLGPPFLTPGVTRIRIAPAHSLTSNATVGGGVLARDVEFIWPAAPLAHGGTSDLSTFADGNRPSSLTTHCMGGNTAAGFTAYCPQRNLQFGYRWNPRDFPWMALWEENKSRRERPWNGETVACGLEFGVSPFPESRRQMVDRGTLFNTRTFRWLGARSEATVEYTAFFRRAERATDDLTSGTVAAQ